MFPLTVFGSNAIAAYVGPILIKVLILREWTWRMPNGVREPLEQTWLHAAVRHYGPYWGGWVYTLAYLGRGLAGTAGTAAAKTFFASVIYDYS